MAEPTELLTALRELAANPTLYAQARHGEVHEEAFRALVARDAELAGLREQLGVARGDEQAGESKVELWINRCRFAYDGLEAVLTGAQIRELPFPSIQDEDDLWIIGLRGSADVVVGHSSEIEVCGREFYSAPRFINAGGDTAAASLALPSPEQGKQTSETTGTVVSSAGRSERYTYEQVTWAATELILQRDELQHRLSLTAKALTWFYKDHVEEGDPPCPCEGCEKARVAFTANLAPLPTASTTALEALPGHDLAAELTQERGVSQVLAEHLAGASEKLHAQAADATRLREALEQAIEVIEWCGENDKTPTYGYSQGDDAKRRDGSLPGAGKAFNTPREFAAYWPDRLRVALSGGGAANKEQGNQGAESEIRRSAGEQT